MISVVTISIQAKNPRFSTNKPPITAPIILPKSPGKPNHTGKTPSKTIGKYRIVKLGTAIREERKKNTAYSAPEIAITETLLAVPKPLLTMWHYPQSHLRFEFRE